MGCGCGVSFCYSQLDAALSNFIEYTFRFRFSLLGRGLGGVGKHWGWW